jgi:hypothetical protein
MVIAFAALLVVHGLIDLLGAAKAFGWAELSQLTKPISPAFGALWLVSALLFLVTAVSVFTWLRGWWVMGACAIVISMVVIIPSWTDAKFGALVNVLVLVGVSFGFLSQGPVSLLAEDDWDVESLVSAPSSATPITDADLAHLSGSRRTGRDRAQVLRLWPWPRAHRGVSRKGGRFAKSWSRSQLQPGRSRSPFGCVFWRQTESGQFLRHRVATRSRDRDRRAVHLLHRKGAVGNEIAVVVEVQRADKVRVRHARDGEIVRRLRG